MSYVYVASSGLIFIFIFLIFRKELKSTADYLLIGINVFIGCFVLADVFIQWKLTSKTVIFQFRKARSRSTHALDHRIWCRSPIKRMA